MILPKSMKLQIPNKEPKKCVDIAQDGIVEIEVDAEMITIAIAENVKRGKIIVKGKGNDAFIIIDNQMAEGVIEFIFVGEQNEKLEVYSKNNVKKDIEEYVIVRGSYSEFVLRFERIISVQEASYYGTFYNFSERGSIDIFAKAKVEKGARDTNTRIVIENFSNVKFVGIPVLEIKERNVRSASHKMRNFVVDDELLIYSKSRGIGKEELMNMIREGILKEIEEKIGF